MKKPEITKQMLDAAEDVFNRYYDPEEQDAERKIAARIYSAMRRARGAPPPPRYVNWADWLDKAAHS